MNVCYSLCVVGMYGCLLQCVYNVLFIVSLWRKCGPFLLLLRLQCVLYSECVFVCQCVCEGSVTSSLTRSRAGRVKAKHGNSCHHIALSVHSANCFTII